VRVQERTAELATTLEQLQIEMVERQRLTEELRQVQKMEAVGRLAGGVAHDFNNILAAMIGYTELATYNIPASNPAWHQLQEVLRAGQRAKALVQQILTFSRRTEQAHTPVQLPPLVEEALALLRASLPSTIAIRHHISQDAGTVLADPTQLQQVLLNLGANAEYAMRKVFQSCGSHIRWIAQTRTD
jgi:C4-dicarboxylate-specific signal transduction histidine kinase